MDRRPRTLEDFLREKDDEETLQNDLSDVNFQALRPSVIHYGREQLEILTNGFANQIGHGGSGTVFKGKALDSEMALAVKILTEGETYMNMWKTELTLLNKFQHENIINLVGYCSDHPPLAIITEYMEHGNLRQHIDSNLNWFLRVRIAYDVAKALHELHANGVALCDFKTSNILMDKDYIPKIADFGIAASEEIPVRWQQSAFKTHGYFHIENPFARGPEVDVFGYGQMLGELLTKERYAGTVPHVIGQLRLHGQLNSEQLKQKFAGDSSYNNKDARKLLQIVDDCSGVTAERPTIEVIVKNFKSLKVGKRLETHKLHFCCRSNH